MARGKALFLVEVDKVPQLCGQIKVKLNIKVKLKRDTSVLRAELLLALPAPPDALVETPRVPQITCVKLQGKGAS